MGLRVHTHALKWGVTSEGSMTVTARLGLLCGVSVNASGPGLLFGSSLPTLQSTHERRYRKGSIGRLNSARPSTVDSVYLGSKRRSRA